MTDAAARPVNQIPTTAGWLGYLGLLPFVVQMLAVVFGPKGEDSLAQHAAFGIASYGAVILSFLGGITWGLTVNNPTLANVQGSRELIYSMLPALAAWAAVLLPAPFTLWFCAIGFAVTFAHDTRTASLHALPAWFLRLRLHLSLGAIVCIVLTAIYR
ncbi:MAG TPA: DUF3429 domain-containing protein [Gammaproteobacteria bacterium]|nr:DUF3429 domain-containing protein [Gammaproteobacteria bacterium]